MFEFIGRFHPVVLHLPIGILLLAIVFDWLSRIKKFRSLKKSVRISLWIGFGTALLSCITGYILSQSGDYEAGSVRLHQWFAISLTILTGIYAWMKTNKEVKSLHKFFSVLILIFLIVTGHLGGTLTHGEGYLSFDSNEEDEDDFANVDIRQAMFYDDLVKPVLSAKCYSCHGASKQKGKLRLDAPEHIAKGGKGGVVLVAGKIDESEMIDRLLLPADDEDHMPPKERKQLTAIEIEVLKLWIASGADFKKSVSESGQLDALQKIITNQEVKPVADIPAEAVTAAPENTIIELRKSGVVVLPVASESNYLSVNLINASSLDQVTTQFASLKEQLIWLKAGNKEITDKHIKHIATLKNLTKLSLDNTAITDDGLAALASLENLQYLNLTDTKITAQGLIALKSLPSLRMVYVYKTQIRSEDKELLIKSFPNATIEFGNYEVPTLASDTAIVKTPANE
jgi:uncharacterized membrane protein